MLFVTCRMILQSLATSADKNLDGSMDWKEFEGFGDFELVFKRWPQMWKILQDDMLAGTTDDLKRCSQLFHFCEMNTCSGISPIER